MGMASSIIGMSVPVGSMTGMILTGSFFNDSTEIKSQMLSLFLYANLVLTVGFTIFMIVFRDKPEHPPSAVALEPPMKRDFGQSIKELRQNPNFLLIALYYMLMFGLYTSFGNL
jgi:Na+/melibiose symporter-like transporter